MRVFCAIACCVVVCLLLLLFFISSGSRRALAIKNYKITFVVLKLYTNLIYHFIEYNGLFIYNY